MKRGYVSSIFCVISSVVACSGGDADEADSSGYAALEEPLAPVDCSENSGQFCAVARSGGAPCSNAYGANTEGCANQMNPPLPSVLRSMSFKGLDLLTGVPSKKVRHFPSNTGCTDSPNGACQQVLPFMQTTRDGRIAVSTQYNTSEISLFAFRPENMGYDFRGLGGLATTTPTLETAQPLLNQNTTKPYDYQAGTVKLDVMLWHNPVESKLGTMSFKKVGANYKFEGPHALSQILCETSSPASDPPENRTRNPYRCRARYAANGTEIEGTCTDITHIIGTQQPFNFGSPIMGFGPRQVELISVDVTMFNAKPLSSHFGDKIAGITDKRAEGGLWVYPRNPSGLTTQIIAGVKVPTLPAFQPYLVSMDAGRTALESKIQAALAPIQMPFPVPEASAAAADAAMKSALEAFMVDAQGCYVSSAPGAAFKPNAPLYCEFWKNRRHRNEFYVDVDHDNQVGAVVPPGNAPTLMHWNGLETGPNEANNNLPGSVASPFSTRKEFAEMTGTADGRLIVFNAIGGGTHYMAMPEGYGCRIDKIEAIRPLAQLPFDPAVAHYPIAQAQRSGLGNARPFEDADGTPFNIGDEMHNIYPWIDREGRNIFSATSPNDRDNWFATNLGTGNFSKFLSRTQPKIGMALGAWTQGRMKILDDGSNLADWAPGTDLAVRVGLYSTRGPNHEVTGTQQIYSQVKQVQVFNSMENEWFHLDAHRPRLPMDVVWNMGTDAQRNIEVAFDDWIDRRAVIVAPMMALSKARPYNVLQKDGFVRKNFTPAPLKDPAHPELGTCSGFGQFGEANWSEWKDAWSKCGQGDPEQYLPRYEFSETPLLVNNATANTTNGGVPESLELRGGARVEPVSLGGVRGKGVYLDGFNDYIATKPFGSYDDGTVAPHWLASAFFDLRAQAEDRTERILFAFGDGSYIALRKRFPHSPTDPSDPNDPQGPQGGRGGNGGAESAGPPSADPTFQIVLFHGPLKATKVISVGTAISEKRYFHLAALVTNTSAMQVKSRVVRIFLDGTDAGSQTFTMSLSTPSGFNVTNGSGKGTFYLGDPGPTFATTRTKRTFKGWVDELRLFKLAQQETGQDYLPELVCNHALGTLVDIGVKPGETEQPTIQRLRDAYKKRFASGQAIPKTLAYCEQMRLGSHSDNADIGPQRTVTGDPRACIDYIHTNPNANAELAGRCLHKAKIDAPNLVWNAQRPDSHNTKFCLSCHQGTTSPFKGLAVTALTPHPLGYDMWQDERRQPLQPIPFMAGAYGGADTADASRSHEQLYNRIFLMSPASGGGRSTDAALSDTSGYATPWFQ